MIDAGFRMTSALRAERGEQPRDEIALRASAGLLLEFAFGHRERVLAFGIFSFRDHPGAGIFLGPKRAARMHEQDLDLGFAPSEHQDAGAALGHEISS